MARENKGKNTEVREEAESSGDEELVNIKDKQEEVKFARKQLVHGR